MSSIDFIFPKWLSHEKSISTIDVHPSMEYFATGSWDQYVKIWSFPAVVSKPDLKIKLLGILKDHTNAVNTIKFSPNGKYLATASDDGAVFLWQRAAGLGNPSTFGIPSSQLKPNEPVQKWSSKSLRCHTGDVTSLSWYSDSSKLVSCSLDRTVIIWDIKTCLVVKQIELKPAISVAVDPLNKYIAIQFLDGVSCVWEPETGFNKEFGKTFIGNEKAVLNRNCWTPDGSFICSTSGFTDRFVVPFFQRNSFNFRFMLQGHLSPNGCVACSRSLFRYGSDFCTIVATGDISGVVSIWILGKYTHPVAVLEGVSTAPILELTFSSDGRYIILALQVSPVTNQSGVLFLDLNDLIINEGLEVLSDIGMNEVKSQILGEKISNFDNSKAQLASKILKSLDVEDDVDMEVLQLTTSEILARQIEKVVDGRHYIQPVLLTTVQKKKVDFEIKTYNKHMPLSVMPYEMNLNWKKPQALSYKPSNTVIINQDVMVTAEYCSIIKLSRRTGRRLSTLFYIGGECRHLSYMEGVIFAVGDKCYLINERSFTLIKCVPCPSSFTNFNFIPPSTISAHRNGKLWLFNPDINQWIGGVPSMCYDVNDNPREFVDNITRILQLNPSLQSSLQWHELSSLAVFNAYTNQSQKTQEILKNVHESCQGKASHELLDKIVSFLDSNWK